MVKNFFTLIFILLGGCQNIGLSGSILTTTPDTGLHGMGLETASDSFFGERTRETNAEVDLPSQPSTLSTNSTVVDKPTQNSQTTSVSLGFNADALDLRANQSLTVSHSDSIKIEAYLKQAFGPDTIVKIGFSGHQGSSQYFLPQGYGILADPTTIRFRHIIIEPRIAMTHTIAELQDIKFDMTAGFGYEFARLNTSIQSALLNIRTQQNIKTPVVSVGLNIATSGDARVVPISIGLAVRKPSGRDASIIGQVGLAF